MTAQQREALYVSGAYLDAYNAIVKPEQVFPVKMYTLRRWTQQIGATGFWLLVALQQQAYRQSSNGWCKVDWATLANEANVGTTTVYRYLRDTEYHESGLCHWVTPHTSQSRTWSKVACRMVQETTRFKVIMDAPLARVDQRGLAQFMMERGGVPGASAGQVAGVLEDLAKLGLDDLLALFNEYTMKFAPPPLWQEEQFYPTVEAALGTLGLDVADKHDWAEQCSRLQRQIMAPTWLGTQYFFKRLMPELGHTKALVVVQLRSRCFWNSTEKSDVVEMGTAALASAVGCDGGWLRKIYAELTRYVNVERGSGKRPPRFKVNLIEPIAHVDQTEYKVLLNTPLTEGGQILLNMPDTDCSVDAPGGGLKPAIDVPGGSLRVIDAPGGIVDALGGGLKTPLGAPDGGLKAIDAPGGIVDTLGGGVLSILSINAGIALGTGKQQQHSDEAKVTRHAAAFLLETFGMVQPFSGRILARKPDPRRIRAWMLYAATQTGFAEQNGVQKYVYNRLMAGDEPPARFMQYADLTATEWRQLWQASHGEPAGLTQKLNDIAGEWHNDFGKMFPNGPFNDDDPVALANALQRAADEEASPAAQQHQPEMSAEEALARGLAMQIEGNVISIYQIWEQACGELQLQLTGATFDTWLGRSGAISFFEGVFTIGVHNSFAKDWLENRMLDMVKRSIKSVVCQLAGRQFNFDLEIRFVVWNNSDVMPLAQTGSLGATSQSSQ